MKIKGFEKLSKTLKDAERALAELDGQLGEVSFNPFDPASIEAAIQEIEYMIDRRLGSYSKNPMIGPMIAGLKEQYRAGITERAAQARLEGDGA